MKKIALLLALVMMISVIPFAANAEAAEYTGSARGFGGMVNVTLTIDGGKITDCVIVGEDETMGVGSRAVEELPAKIVEAGSADVEAVAGASITSAAIKAAAQDALDQAAGTAAAPAAMVPGTYRATAEGFAAEVVIDVTVDESSILAIDVVSSHETPAVGGYVLTANAAKMVENQSLVIDEVAGATFSSTALFNAVSDALTQAGANVSDFMTDCTTPLKVTDPEAFQADIIVVGAGVSGMTAAMNAAGYGVKVMVFEQLGRLGGAGVHAGGAIMGADSKLQYVFGVEDTAEQCYEFLKSMCSGGAGFNEGAMKAFCDESGETVNQFTDWGVLYKGFSKGTASSHANSDIPRYSSLAGTRKGMGLIETLSNTFYRYMDEGRIGLQLNARVTSLIKEDGKIVGVVVTNKDGSTYEYRAPITIVSAGGYANGGELLKYTFDRCGCSGSNGALGNMVQPVLDVGGVLNGVGTDFAFPGMLDTTDSGSLQVKYEAYYTNPGFVWVDKNCQRIVNEQTTDAAERTSTWIKAENNTVYMLFTEDIIGLSERSVLNYGGYACYEDDIGNELFYKLAEEGKLVKKADTIRELAEKAGLDADALEATVARYNGFCETGIDEDFGRTESLAKLENGPFYLIETIPSAKSTNAGVVIDAEMHVMDADGNVIPGLYASGEFVGGSAIFGNQTFPGGGIGQAAVLGRIAGINAARDTILAQ